MALIRCPECQREVSDQATACPSCGYPLRAGGWAPAGQLPFRAPHYEYKSKRTVFGLPLVHIVYGPAWAVGTHTLMNDPRLMDGLRKLFPH